MTESIFSMEHATKTDLEKYPTKADLKAELEKALHAQTWRFLGGVAAIMAILTAASRLLP